MVNRFGIKSSLGISGKEPSASVDADIIDVEPELFCGKTVLRVIPALFSRIQIYIFVFKLCNFCLCLRDTTIYSFLCIILFEIKINNKRLIAIFRIISVGCFGFLPAFLFSNFGPSLLLFFGIKFHCGSIIFSGMSSFFFQISITFLFHYSC